MEKIIKMINTKSLNNRRTLFPLPDLARKRSRGWSVCSTKRQYNCVKNVKDMKTLSPEKELLSNQPGGPNPASVTRKCDNEGMSLLIKEFACTSCTVDWRPSC